MMHVEPSFVLYALLLDPGCCLRAHTVLSGTVEPVNKQQSNTGTQFALRPCSRTTLLQWVSMLLCTQRVKKITILFYECG